MFCSLQGLESRTARISYRERGLVQREEDGEGGAPQTRRGVFPVGMASLLARAPQTLGFKHRMESCSIQLPSSSGSLCMADASAKQALENTARKKRNHCSPATAFLTPWCPCQVPFRGCVGWASSTCSILSQWKAALHVQEKP